MSSSYSPWFYRKVLYKIPGLFKKCPEGNYHWFWDRLCFCRENQFVGNEWHGGILDLKTGVENNTEAASQAECLVVRFNACKYLDFSDIYTAKKQILGSGKVFWMRDVSYDPTLPSMVQFCSRYGRLSSPEACLCDKNKHCSDYVDFEHIVNVPDA